MKALFDAIDCVLQLLEPYDAYEKCSPDHGESTGTNKNDTRHTNPIICKEKLIFIVFQKMIPRFLTQVFTHFDIHLQKRLYMATLRVSKKNLRVRIKNPLLRICQKCSGDYFGMSHVAVGPKFTRGFAKNQKNTKNL